MGVIVAFRVARIVDALFLEEDVGRIGVQRLARRVGAVLIAPGAEIRPRRAALQLTGTFLGFALPVAMVIANSVSIPDMLLWGAVAAIVQLAVFVVIARLLFRGISAKIDEGCNSSGIFVGGMGLGIGVLQAACMVP